MKKRFLEYGGIAASVILIVAGLGAMIVGFGGRDTVRSELGREKITGTPDMTPALTRKAVSEAGLKDVTIPTCSVAGKSVNTGSEARCFASYMRIHALESTGGQVYAEMGRFLDKSGKATSDEKQAAVNPETGRPVENAQRNLWVTETALATALQTTYFAENVALFSMLMGLALLLTGIGFLILTMKALHVPAEAREGARVASGKPAPTH